MPGEPTIARIERAFAAGWPALETVRAGAWEARLSNGLTRRANAIQCYDPGDDEGASSRLPGLAALYRARGLAPLFRVTPLTGRADYKVLVEGGWRPEGETLVLARALTEPAGSSRGQALVSGIPDPDWIAGQVALQGYGPADAEVFTSICHRIGGACAGLAIAEQGRVVASALVVVVKSIAVFCSVITDPARRGQGFGKTLAAAGLDWAVANGARHAALQVEADNGPAIGLYRRLGFAFRYPYHYRRAPEASA